MKNPGYVQVVLVPKRFIITEVSIQRITVHAVCDQSSVGHSVVPYNDTAVRSPELYRMSTQ